MAAVLILSSFVAASRVGGGAQALALARLGIEPILIPTSLLGRHPGWGAPGGGPVAAETMDAMLDGVAAQGALAVDAVITGHFSAPAQVDVAVRAIAMARQARPGVTIIVDPVMGDEDAGLYVGESVADALANRLAPLGDILAPNAWELARLTGLAVSDPVSAVVAARTLGRPVLVSSLRFEGEIGVAWIAGKEGSLISHPRSPRAPKGAGDLLTALFTAGLVQGRDPRAAAACAVSAVAEAVASAGASGEFPVAAFPERLGSARNVRIRPLP